MNIRTIIVLALLACLASVTEAHTIGVHIGSQHFPNATYNNINPGAYFKHDSGATVGAYRNSFRKASAYVGWTFEYGSAAVTVGGITGYSHTGARMIAGDVALMVAPSIRLPVSIGGISPRLAYLPKAHPKGAHVLHLMLEF